MKDVLQSIIAIGKAGSCPFQQMKTFLPCYPGLSGDDIIFRISWKDAKRLAEDDFKFLVHGLHYIELRYRVEQRYSFGFGSPSRTHQLIHNLSKRNHTLAAELTTWIASNGGNYYIKPLSGTETEVGQKGLFD